MPRVFGPSRELLVPGLRLPLLPVVDRETGHADQEAVVLRGEPEALTIRLHPPGCEAYTLSRARLGRHLEASLLLLLKEAHAATKLGDLALERLDRAAQLRFGLLEGADLFADLLASEADDLLAENGGDVGHGRSFVGLFLAPAPIRSLAVYGRSRS